MSIPSDATRPAKPERFASLIAELGASFPKARFEPTDDPAQLASQISRNVPEAERTRWHGYLLKDAIAPAPAGLLGLSAGKLGYIVLAIAAIAVLAGLLLGLLWPGLGFREGMGDAAQARGVITFLFAFGTITIALLIAAASYWVRDAEELKARFGYAKDVLMVLIGILGTIIGFYFGKPDPGTTQPEPQATAAAASSTGAPPPKNP